nr:PREDICTED: thrombopoietin receptor [Latimeria chalumnae]|eukprot:XP_014351900.1 PREDICTED: thrombopoietin receptor [Latimeria chalumnae]
MDPGVGHTEQLHYKVLGGHDRSSKVCHVTTERLNSTAVRHVCNFPLRDIRLFAETVVEVIQSELNVTKRTRNFYVESVVFVDPPNSVLVSSNGNPGELLVHWEPPENPLSATLRYKIVYFEADSKDSTNETKVIERQQYTLRGLRPGLKYGVCVRANPKDDTYDGFWSSCLEHAYAITPSPSDKISLQCLTSDLQHVTCSWEWKVTENSSSVHTLTYLSSNGRWMQCINQSAHREGDTIKHGCVFLANVTTFSLEVNVNTSSYPLTYQDLNFNMEKNVLTDPPKIVWTEVRNGKLTLEWEPMVGTLAGHMEYEICFSEDKSDCNKVKLHTKSASTEELSVQAGKQYYLKIRTKPNGTKYQGPWSRWSELYTVGVPSEIGFTVLLIFIGLVALLLMVIPLKFIFPKMYRQETQASARTSQAQIISGPAMHVNKGYIKAIPADPVPPLCEKAFDDVLPSLVEIISDLTELKEKSQEKWTSTLKKPPSHFFPTRHSLSENGTFCEELSGEDPSYLGYVSLDPKVSLSNCCGNEYIDERTEESQPCLAYNACYTVEAHPFLIRKDTEINRHLGQSMGPQPRQSWDEVAGEEETYYKIFQWTTPSFPDCLALGGSGICNECYLMAFSKSTSETVESTALKEESKRDGMSAELDEGFICTKL